MGVMGRNVKLMKQMEKWTPEDAKAARTAHPIGAGGRALSKNPRPGTVTGIKPKVRAAAFAVIARSRAARRAAGQKKK